MKEPMATALDWLDQWKGRIFLIAAAAWAAVWLASHVQMLGEMPRNLLPGTQQLDMQLDYALGVLCWGVFAVGIWLLGGEERHHLLIAWVGKFFVILVLMLFYEFKYRHNLDAYSYFSTVLTGQYFMYPGIDWRQESWLPTLEQTRAAENSIQGRIGRSPGTENMLRLLMIFSQFTGPHYHALKVVFAFFGFIGLWFIYRAVVILVGRPFPLVFYGLMFYPSILFWSSILGKDPIFLFFLGLYAYGAVVWLARGSPVGLMWIGFALVWIYTLRSWMAAVAAAPFLLAAFVRQFSMITVLVVFSVGFPVLFFATDLGNRLKAFEADAMIEELASRAEGQIEGGSGAGLELIEAQELLQTPAGIALVIFSGIFRPLPFDVSNFMVAVAAVENSILLILALAAFRHIRWGVVASPICLWLSAYILTWGGAYGLVVLSNFGAGMRYKLQVLPFLIMLLLFLLHEEARPLLVGRKPSLPQRQESDAGGRVRA